MSKGFGNLMRQAQQMQKKMGQLNAELATKEYTGEAAQGTITVTVTGNLMLKKIVIDPSHIDPEEAETLEDLIVVACNAAMTRARTEKEEQMSSLTGGMTPEGLF